RRTACSRRRRSDRAGDWPRPRSRTRAPAGSCAREPCSFQPASVNQYLAQPILRRATLGECLLEGRDSLRERRDLLADRRQHVAGDVERPVLALDLVEADHPDAIFHVLEGADPSDDLSRVLGVEEVLGAALAEEARRIDDQDLVLALWGL